MENKTISQIKQWMEKEELKEEEIAKLKKDPRKGIQLLVHQYEKKKQKEIELEKRFSQMCQYENTGYENGCRYIAGTDEAGRGPLAGPIVAAAVILPSNWKLPGLNDSKQLNEKIREAYYSTIKKEAISYGISIVSNERIDELNIYEAVKLAMRDAINQLDPAPDYVLIDAVHLTDLPCRSQSIVKGDEKSVSIAAASILAKVTRDRLMQQIHHEYPVYDFKSNMGYGTKHHLKSMREHGITPYHRKSFAPVRDLVL
ncbi:ribonuclease HII [Virgibacillus kimchii]